MSAPVLLLPRLSPEKGPAVPPAGAWAVPNKPDFLHDLASSLHRASDGERAGEVVAVPDLWAQVVVFEAALLDREHPFHRCAVGEWRGLLTVLALTRHRSLPVQLERLPVVAPGGRADAGRPPGSAGRGGALFARLAAEMRPTRALVEGEDWAEIGTIELGGRAIGLVVPSTLVCPTRGYHRLLGGSGISWLEAGRLTTPAPGANLSPEEFHLIRDYVAQVRDGVRHHAADLGEADSCYRGVVAAFEDFLKDLDQTIGSPPATTVELTREPAVWNVPHLGIYEALLTHIDTVVRQSLHHFVPVRPEFGHLLKGAILLDRDMPSRLNKPAGEIRLWGRYSLANVLGNAALEQKIRDEAAAQGYLLLKPEQLFSDRLCRLTGQTLVGHPANAQAHILPLGPLALLFLAPEALRRGFLLTSNGGSASASASASLRLPLRSAATGAESEYFVRQDYPQEVKRAQPRFFDVWPDFKADDWEYNLFYCNSPSITAIADPLPLSTRRLQQLLQSYPSERERIDALGQLRSALELHKQCNTLLLDHDAYEGIFLERFAIEAIHCCLTEARAGGEGGHSVAAGLILLPERPTPAPSSDQWRIGIDFGTTNTIAYYRAGVAEPHALTFQKRLVSPFSGPGDQGAWQQALENFNFPIADAERPYLSVLRERKAGHSAAGIPVWNEHIFFYLHPSEALKRISRQSQPSTTGQPLKFNLKWSDDPADRRRLTTFLAHTALLCLAEAVARGVAMARVDWSFSYPEAFTQERRDTFRSLAADALILARSPTSAGQTGRLEPALLPESTCSAHYFAATSAGYFTESVLTLDLGGHTTDVTLWQSNRALWGGSLVLAGQHILVNFLAKTPTLLESLLEGLPMLEGVQGFLGACAGRAEPLRDGIEAVINAPRAAFSTPLGLPGSEDLWRNYNRLCDTPEAKRLRRIAELALCGILFYVAQVMRKLAQEGRYQPLRDRLTICVGGRASRFYQVFSERSSRDYQAISGFFEEAAGLARSPGALSFSPRPKHEVAYGLLVDGAITAETKGLDVILGEQLAIGGNRFAPDHDAGDLPTDADWRIDDFVALDAFLTLYQRRLGRVVPLALTDGSADRARLEGPINGRLGEIRREREQRRQRKATAVSSEVARVAATEPVFIIVLREVIRLLIEDRRLIAEAEPE